MTYPIVAWLPYTDHDWGLGIPPFKWYRQLPIVRPVADPSAATNGSHVGHMAVVSSSKKSEFLLGCDLLGLFLGWFLLTIKPSMIDITKPSNK